MKIAINAGHYPNLESGAVGQTGLQEAAVARDIAILVCHYLEQVGYDVLLIQENELYQITDASNSFGADLFVSIHCNADENRNAKGTETFCYSQASAGYRLASCIQSQIIDSLDTVTVE